MIKAEMSRTLLREIKKFCKAAFPKERFGFLLGIDVGDLLVVEQVYWPDDQEQYAGREIVYVPDHWYLDAAQEAADEDLKILGDLHSHLYPNDSFGSFRADAVQSEEDLTNQWGRLHGVCAINQRASGVLVARFRLWHSTPQLEVEYT